MNTFKNLHTAFSLKSFVAAAILFSLFALSGHLTIVKAQSRSVWKLKEVRVIDNMYPNLGKVISQRHDANGGEIEVNVNGNASGLCPGGEERMRFAWRFTSDTSQVVTGGAVNVSLGAAYVSATRPCGGALSASSHIGLYGSEGFAGPSFPQSEGNRIDGDRFNNSYKQPKAWADPNDAKRRVTSGGVNVQTHEPRDIRTLAYFDILIATAGGPVHYIYLYELSSSGGGCGLGVSWDESESGWTGKWTRRGNSNVFDAYWQKSGWTPINQILTVTVSGSYVSIHRQDPSISNNTCSYTGTIGADGVTVSGQYSCNNRGTIYGPAKWSAKINCGSNVSSAEITKMRQWIAHYDNLIVQWTQYRDQKVAPYYNHPTYYQWARSEYQKANQAISTSQQYKAHYQNLLRQAGAQ